MGGFQNSVSLPSPPGTDSFLFFGKTTSPGLTSGLLSLSLLLWVVEACDPDREFEGPLSNQLVIYSSHCTSPSLKQLHASIRGTRGV